MAGETRGYTVSPQAGHSLARSLSRDRVGVPLLPRVNREQTFQGSYWGNNTDLSEVLALAAQDKIRHTIKIFTFDQINENLELIRAGDIVGRAVLTF